MIKIDTTSNFPRATWCKKFCISIREARKKQPNFCIFQATYTKNLFNSSSLAYELQHFNSIFLKFNLTILKIQFLGSNLRGPFFEKSYYAIAQSRFIRSQKTNCVTSYVKKEFLKKAITVLAYLTPQKIEIKKSSKYEFNSSAKTRNILFLDV